MKRYRVERIVALLLAALLLAPAAGLAEDAIGIEDAVGNEFSMETVDVLEASESPEAGVEELTQDLGELSGTAYSLPDDAGEAAEAPAAEAPAEEPQASQNEVPEKIEIGVKEKYTLDAKALAPGKKISYKSSKSKVAKVSSKGVVTGVKKGTAYIACYVGKTLLATCQVKVVAAPSKVSLGVKTMTIGVKQTWQLTPTITKGSHATFTWSSSKKSIATVSKAGVVTGKKAGKATITVKTQNGKKASVTVTVVKAPSKVTLNKSSVTLSVGGGVQLKATLPKNTVSPITWASDDSAVATVDANGYVTAVGAGTATVFASTYNGKIAGCVVSVQEAAGGTTEDTPQETPADNSEVVYRALLIGEEYFATSTGTETATRNRGDVVLMTNMLNSVRGLYGGYYGITRKYNLTSAQVLSAISSTFAGADENDVSLFFIATHGDSGSSGTYAGRLAMSPDGDLTLKRLANALAAVPGKVIVILESCGSGAAVYGNGDSHAPSEADMAAAAEAFDRAAVAAFSEADPGIEVTLQSHDMDSSGHWTNSGEFRVENKFYVLTASRYQEDSWGIESSTGSFNLFTKWLTDGIGTSGSMEADADRNGQTTLDELYRYIADVGDNHPVYSQGEYYYQHVQVYPSNSSYVLFVR